MDWEKEGKRAPDIVRNVYNSAWKIKATASFIAELFLYGQKSVSMGDLLLLFSHPVVSNSLPSHGLQHTRPPCPSPSPTVCPSSCSLHWWCLPAIWCPLMPSDALFFCPLSFPASGTFPCLFASDDQNTGTSASESVIPVNIQSWSPLRLTCLISVLSDELSGVFFSTTVWRHQFFGALPSLWSSCHNHTWPLGRS